MSSQPTDRLFSSRGFSLLELVVALGISLIIGIAGFWLILNSVESQKRVEKILGKGYNGLRYQPGDMPTAPPRLAFQSQAGFTRVASRRAIDPKTGDLTGPPVNDASIVRLIGPGAANFEAEWAECTGDKEVELECGPFSAGESFVRYKRKNETAKSADFRVRVAWKNLAPDHPFKRSETYHFRVSFVKDCEYGDSGSLPSGGYKADSSAPATPPTADNPCGYSTWRFCLNGVLQEEKVSLKCVGG